MLRECVNPARTIATNAQALRHTAQPARDPTSSLLMSAELSVRLANTAPITNVPIAALLVPPVLTLIRSAPHAHHPRISREKLVWTHVLQARSPSVESVRTAIPSVSNAQLPKPPALRANPETTLRRAPVLPIVVMDTSFPETTARFAAPLVLLAQALPPTVSPAQLTKSYWPPILALTTVPLDTSRLVKLVKSAVHHVLSARLPPLTAQLVTERTS
jgi:hypothetical protein